MDRFTKSAVFMPMKETWKMELLAKAYIKHVVRLHGVPKVIVWIGFQVSLEILDKCAG